MKNKFFRTFAVTLAAVLCLTAFSTTAFAGGADPDPAPLPEETGTPTTGGIELDTEDAEGDNDTSSTTEDTENTEDKESTGTAETMTDEEMAALLSCPIAASGRFDALNLHWLGNDIHGLHSLVQAGGRILKDNLPPDFQ